MKTEGFFRVLMIVVLFGTITLQAVPRALAQTASAPPAGPAAPLADRTVYADALAPGWADWSWDSTVAFDNASPTFSGVASIAVTFNAAFAGFSLRTSPALSPADFSAVSFFVYAPGTDRALSLAIQSSDDGGLGQAFNFNAPADQWSQIVVGLDSLGNPPAIARINIQDNSGAPQAVFYLDEITLIGTGSGASADIPAVIPGAPKPTISIDPGHGYSGQTIGVSGVAPAGSGGVRLAWLFDGATFNAGEALAGGGGAYSATLEVPTGAPEGPAQVCAAISGSAQAVYACVDFTVDPPAPGEVSGQADAALIAPGKTAEVRLLNRGGDTLYSALLSSSGAFTLNNVYPGIYELVVVGALGGVAASSEIKVDYARKVNADIHLLLAGGLYDPVAGKTCAPKNNQASVSSLRARYTDRGLGVTGAGKSPEGADGYGSGYATKKMESIINLLVRRDFGTFLSGVRLDNSFSASLQSISGTVDRVEFHVELPDGTLRSLGSDSQAPYEVGYDVGQLPPGTSTLYAAAVVNGVRQCPKDRSITVVANPMANPRYQPGAFANWDAEAELYRFGGVLPNVGGALPLAFPAQPTSLPLIGNVQSKLGAGISIAGDLYLDGVMQVQVMSVDAQAVLLGIPLYRENQALTPPRDGRFYTGTSLRDFHTLAIPTGPRTLWQDRYDQTVFNSVLFSFWGIVTVGARVRIGFSGELIMDAIIYPLDPGVNLALTPGVGVYLSAGIWVNVLILASAGVDVIPSIHFWLPLEISSYDSRGVWFDEPCFGLSVDLNIWAEVDYLFDTWRADLPVNLFSIEEPRGCKPNQQQAAQLAELIRANAAAAPPASRVMASPQVAASFSGRVISVYVEDTTPQAEHPSGAVMARFKDLQTGAWLPAVQLSDGLHAVNDPAAAFFGFDGDQAVVAWTQTDMTPAEETAADSIDDYLNQMEIYMSRWDGETWSAPQALTGDLQGDGFPAVAGDRDGVTLAWVRDGDGDAATTSDMVIALRDWSPNTGLGEMQTLTAGPGLNAQPSIARMDKLVGSDTVIAWTYDADGSHTTLEDRRLQMAVRGQAANPAEWVLLNPQPLPPRVEMPSVTFESGNTKLLRLAFVVHNLEGDGQSAAALSDNSSIWTASVDLSGQTPVVAGKALLDGAGNEVIGERPRLQTDDAGETLLVFRRFGEVDSQGQLGQAAVSQFVVNAGMDNFTPPVYLTGGLNQHWQSAAALDPTTRKLELLTVERPPVNPAALQALGATNSLDIGVAGYNPQRSASRHAPLSPAALSAAAAQVALLRSLAAVPQAAPEATTALTAAANDDPLIAMEFGSDGDPALDPLLQLSQPHAAIGSSVTVTATVRNLGRTAVPATVLFYRGQPGSGDLVAETPLSGLLAVGESRAAAASYTVQGGEEPVYAEVAIGINYTDGNSANNTATARLGALPAVQIASVQPSQVFEDGLEVAIIPSAAQAVAGYRVMRSQTPGGPYELVGETTGNVQYDVGLTRNQTYCYVVQAYDRLGMTSPYSGEVCGLLTRSVRETKVFMPVMLSK